MRETTKTKRERVSMPLSLKDVCIIDGVKKWGMNGKYAYIMDHTKDEKGRIAVRIGNITYAVKPSKTKPVKNLSFMIDMKGVQDILLDELYYQGLVIDDVTASRVGVA